jgi:hypothetical protein
VKPVAMSKKERGLQSKSKIDSRGRRNHFGIEAREAGYILVGGSLFNFILCCSLLSELVDLLPYPSIVVHSLSNYPLHNAIKEFSSNLNLKLEWMAESGALTEE